MKKVLAALCLMAGLSIPAAAFAAVNTTGVTTTHKVTTNHKTGVVTTSDCTVTKSLGG